MIHSEFILTRKTLNIKLFLEITERPPNIVFIVSDLSTLPVQAFLVTRMTTRQHTLRQWRLTPLKHLRHFE